MRSEAKEIQYETQISMLTGIQRSHSRILTELGIVSKATEAVKNQLGKHWSEDHEAITPHTAFVVSRGPVIDNLRHSVEYFCVTKLEGGKRMWGVEVGHRLIEQSSLGTSKGFGLNDVLVVSKLADSLIASQASGELSRLDYYLDKIK